MSYPISTEQFVTRIDKNASGWYVGPEYFNVPSVSPYELYLDHVPKESASTVISASGGAAWLEIFSGTPGGNQYLIDYDYGKVTFAASDAGAAVQATYYNLGDDIMAAHVNVLQREVAAIEDELGANVSGESNNLVDRINVIMQDISASGIDGQRIIDDSIRAGALMDDIKGSSWAPYGRPTLSSIVDHRLSSSAHMAEAILINQPSGVTFTTVQDHIEAVGIGTLSDRNPHAMSMYDIDQGILNGSMGVETLSAGLIGASGNIVPITGSAYPASGMYDIGLADDPWASGNFNSVRSNEYIAGDSAGVNGSFTAGANTIIVRNGIIVSIL
jgi:hypothetical protein